MSAFGDRLREQASRYKYLEESEYRTGLLHAAALADTHEAAALAESAQGRGPHAAAALLWAAERVRRERPETAWAALARYADEAER